MTCISKIHQVRLPPPHLVPLATSLLCKEGSSYSLGPSIPPDAQVIIGEPSCLQNAKFPNLKLLIVPFAGPFISDSLRTLLKEEYSDLPILTVHHNAVPTAEMGLALLLAAAKQVFRNNYCTVL